jgi:hypothetical protein
MRNRGGIAQCATNAAAGAPAVAGMRAAPRCALRAAAAIATLATLALPSFGAWAAPRVQPSTTPGAQPGAPAAVAGVQTEPAAPAATATTPASALRPHVVSFAVAFKGIGAGTIELRLTREGPNLWRYETRPQPSMLARMIISASSIERGTFSIGPDGVEPRDYSLDDGTPKRTRDEVALDYDRAAGRVRGFARGEPLDLPLVPRLQDPLSIRAALLNDLLAGREPGEYPMVDGRDIETFVYRKVGPAQLKTALGEIDTVVYTSSRKGADARAKTWKYWYAPSLGWLPVRIEQRDQDGPRLVFTIRAATFP